MLPGMDAWNGWYHVNGNSYGTWLPGDPRGWRSKRHKRHVAGDYKAPPPPGTDDAVFQYSRGQLKKPPVHLTAAQRQTAGQAMVEMLVDHKVEVIALCLNEAHFHLLTRFPDKEVRPLVGTAKRHAFYVLRDQGHSGRLWTMKCKVTPIRDRQHQVNVFHYICRHGGEGAWAWTFRDGLSWTPTILRK